jgi:hypothetical protein
MRDRFVNVEMTTLPLTLPVRTIAVMQERFPLLQILVNIMLVFSAQGTPPKGLDKMSKIQNRLKIKKHLVFSCYFSAN